MPAPITGEEIRALREKAHLSQAVFARDLNRTVGYVSQLERGAKRPTGELPSRSSRRANYSSPRRIALRAQVSRYFGTIDKAERSENLGRKTGAARLCILAHGFNYFAHDVGKSLPVEATIRHETVAGWRAPPV